MNIKNSSVQSWNMNKVAYQRYLKKNTLAVNKFYVDAGSSIFIARLFPCSLPYTFILHYVPIVLSLI